MATEITKTPIFAFNEERHEYSEDGVIYPSCTQILESIGVVDFSGVDPRVLENKRWIGIEAHKCCQYLDEYRLGTSEFDLDWESVDPAVEPYVRAYEKFVKDFDFRPRMIEKRFIATSHGMKYGVTIDREGLLKLHKDPAHKPYIVELKCTADAEDYWALQTGGYKLSLPPPKEPPWDYGRVAVQLKPDATYKLHPHDEDTDGAVFIAGLVTTAWKINHRYKIKK